MGDLASGLKLDGGTLLSTASFTTLSRAITIGAADGTFDTNGFDLTLGAGALSLTVAPQTTGSARSVLDT
jgi:hypothetical protein